MTDTGLSDRLRQQSRRSGMMVGLSMALTIAVCIGAFVFSYARLGSLASDFVSQEATFVPTPNLAATGIAAVAPPPEPTPTPAPPPPVDEPAAEQAQAGPTATGSAFQPTHQSNSQFPINFRSTPGASDENTILFALPVATPLQYLGEERTVDGAVWMRFRTAEGEEGWIREIDSEPYEENP